MAFSFNSLMRFDVAPLWSVDQLQEAARQQTARQNLIKSNFANIYNNNNLTTQQKAQQINQFAQQNNISRDEIASAMNLGANDLNAFLDTDPAIVQNRVQGLIGQWNTTRSPEASSQLEALGFELFDPDGPEYYDEFGGHNTAPAKWLSPQEAASVTGTKINNQLRNQAYVQSTDYLASQLSPLANQLRQRLDAVNASGKLVANQPARYYNEVANRLTQRTGITDLNDVGVRKIDATPLEVGGGDFPSYTVYVRKDNGQHIDNPNEIYNKKTGQVYGYGALNVLGTFGNQQDETSALLRVGPDGNLKLDAGYAYEQEAWKDVVTALAPIALNFVPGVGQFLGAAILPAGTSAAIQTAVGNAVLKAGIDVATGVPVETALKNGLVSVGINQGIPNLSDNAYIDNAVKAVSVAALTGGDVEAALVNSVISTGGKEALGNVSLTGDKVVDSAIASAVTSGLSAAATGGDVGASVAQGFGSGLSAGINTQNQVTTIPGVPAQTITGAAGNDSIPAGVGVDTVGGIAGADTVNAGVAENDVLDLIQRDIDTSVANNVQDVSNAEQEVQPVTPVEPGTSDGSVAQDDVLGVVAQEQADIRAQTASQAMQGAKQITAAEAAARELYPLTERYQGPNGTIYVRDINTGKITQLLPTGEASAITGGGVFLDRPDVIGAVEALPANAVYQGILYANDPKLIGKQLTADDLENLSLSTDRDANVLPVGNLVVRQNADGTVTQFDKVTGDTATIDASGKIVGQTKSLYTRLNDTANAVTGTGQSALGELGASLSATGQQLGLNTQGLIENFQAMQAAGERMRPETVNQQSTAFVNEIYQIASRPGVTAKEIAEAVVNASKNNPIGAVAVLGSELIQELPALLLPGGNVAKFLGSMALNVGESAGAQALQKIDELKVSNPTATPQELARLARQDAGIAALTTASLSLIPGANNALVRTLTEPFSEALEEGLIEYATSGDINAARGKAVLGAVIGGKTSTAINTGEQLASAAQAKLGVQLPSNTPIASITVTAPRDATGVVSSDGVDLDLNEDIVGELPPTDLTDSINIPINVGSTANNALTISTGGDNAVAGDESNGVVLQNNNDGTSLVLTQGGGSTVVPSVDSSTGNQLQPGSTVVVNTANNTASTAPVTQPTGSEVVSQDAGQVGGTGSTLPSTPTGGASTGSTAVVTQAPDAALQAEIDKIMRMAVKKEAADLRYDVNKDGRVNVFDALLVSKGQATIPTVEEYAAQQSASSSTAPSTTPQVTQPVDQTPAATAPSTGPETSTGVVLQNNGDGTALVLTNDGNATNVPATDAVSNEPLTPGSSVSIDQNTNTATSTPPASVVGAQESIVSVPPTVQDTGDQQVLGGGQQPTTDAGSIIDTTIGPDTSTGIVLQNNGDGTALVLTQDGGATNVPSVDATTGTALTPGASVTVDTSNNTATVASTATDTSTAVTSGTDTSTQADTQTQTGTQTATDTTTKVQPETVTQTQLETGAQTQSETVTPTSEVTGIVLQNNGDGTVLVLTNNGNASIVSDVDNNTGGTLTTGSSVVVDNNTGTASSTGTGTGTGVSDTATGATTGATTDVDTSGAVTAGTGVTTGATTGDTTGATTGAVTGVTTGDQVDTGGTQVLPEITTVGGTTSTDSTGTSTLTPGINVELPETIGGGTAVEDNVSGGGGNDLIVGGGSNDVIAGETTGTTTEEDLLLEQIIKELETTTPVSEGVPIQEPEFPEPPLVLPESPTINVGDRLAVRPVVDRGYRRPSVSPGSRVEESAQILPLRPGLSEGGTGGIEGTTEQEQEPVWNVRSLKLRRLLGI